MQIRTDHFVVPLSGGSMDDSAKVTILEALRKVRALLASEQEETLKVAHPPFQWISGVHCLIVCLSAQGGQRQADDGQREAQVSREPPAQGAGCRREAQPALIVVGNAHKLLQLCCWQHGRKLCSIAAAVARAGRSSSTRSSAAVCTCRTSCPSGARCCGG